MVTAVTSTTSSSANATSGSTTSSKAAANITTTLGSGSGIDTKSLAANLVAAERAPREASINKNIVKNEGVVSGMAAVKYAISNVKTAFDDLKDLSDYTSIRLTNSAPSAFAATASSLATAGNHSITVTTLAKPQRLLSGTTWSAADDAVSSSDITLTLTASGAGTDVTGGTITVASANSTPAGVVSAINAANLGVSAYLQYTGSAYQIMVTGPEGAKNGFTLSSSDTTNLPFASTNLQESGDAVLTVDGVAITSSSNAVTDAIGGVTLNLLGTTSSASLGLSNDTAAAKTKLQSLVTAYNDAMNIFDEVTNPKSTLETYGATLVGNSSVRSLRDTLRSMITAASTTPTTDGSYSYLHDIGVNLDSTGKLTLSTSALDTALASNFSDVVYLMTGNQEALSTYDTTTAAGIAGEASRTLVSALSTSGTLTTESANATDRIAKYKEDLTKLEDRMTQLLARYTKQFSTMDSMVGQTKSTQTGLTSTFAGLMAMYTNK